MPRLSKSGKRTKSERIAIAASKKMSKANATETANQMVKRVGKRNRKRSKHPRVERIAKAKGSLLVENAKRMLLLRGHKTSSLGVDVLRDLSRLKKPHSKLFTKKNNILPFEDDSSLRFLCQKNDCSLFALVSHNKKRPHNLVLGRMFNWEVLDMIEVGVEKYLAMDHIPGNKKALGNKPMMLFQGDEFEHDEKMKALKSILLDMFRGQETDSIHTIGLDSVLVCSAHEGKCHLRWYFVVLEDSDTKAPKAKLKNMGPFLDLTIRRCQIGPKELRKLAMRRPKQLKKRKQKNVTTNEFGETIGRVFKKRQSLDEMQTRKMKALKKPRVESALAADENA